MAAQPAAPDEDAVGPLPPLADTHSPPTCGAEMGAQISAFALVQEVVPSANGPLESPRDWRACNCAAELKTIARCCCSGCWCGWECGCALVSCMCDDKLLESRGGDRAADRRVKWPGVAR